MSLSRLRASAGSAAFFGVCASAALFTFSALGAVDFKPGWMNKPYYEPIPTNQSFLANTRDSFDHTTYKLFDPNQMRDMKQKYEDMIRDYEMRQNYHLTDYYAIQVHTQQLSDFSRDVTRSVQNYQVHQQMSVLKTAAENDPTLMAARKPIGVVAGVAAFYQGSPFDMQVTPDTRLSGATSVRDQKGRLAVSSPIISGSAEFSAVVPSNYDPTLPPPADAFVQDERYRFSLARDIPFAAVSTGVTYGSSSSTIVATVSKQITPHLRGEVASLYPIDPDSSDVKQSEGRFRLVYGINF